MNCKPGDLAIVVRASKSPSILGRLVRCIRLIDEGEPVCGVYWVKTINDSTWEVEGVGAPLEWGDLVMLRRAIADVCLRPIRDPGDDARDETFEWLPVPTKEHA